MPGFALSPRVLLKARPTDAQLADRLSAEPPEGIELYLDVADIAGSDWRRPLAARIERLSLPDDFAWVVEGPLRSLDGEFFDLGRESAADADVLERITELAGDLGALAVVVHCIAPVRSTRSLTEDRRAAALERAESNLRGYARLCLDRGLVPTIENVPPVARMREQAFVHSLIGMDHHDLSYFADRVPGLMVALDTSHAQLFLNAVAADPAEAPPQIAPMVSFLRERWSPGLLPEYIDRLGTRLYEAHISNAAGLLEEGLPYETGDLHLDAIVRRLLPTARFLVTEPLESDPDRAEHMRPMARRLLALRDGLATERMRS